MKWIECTLGDILNFRRGYDLPHSEMSGGDIPVAGSNGVIGYHNKATDISPVITIGRSGNVGTPYIYDRAWAHNTTLFIDDFKGNDPLYLYYLIKTLPLASFGGGSAVPTLNRNHIHPLIVKHCPDVEEQKRIASFLNAFDEKIELNKRINHNLLNVAQEIFDSEVARIHSYTDSYKKSSLLGIADYLNGVAMQKYPTLGSEDGLPVLKIKELGQQFCDSTSDRCTKNIPDQYVVHDGDIVFSWSGTLLVDFWCGGECGLNQHLFKVSARGYPAWFAFFWTKHHLDRFIRIAKDKAVTMGHIKRSDLGKAEVYVPDEDSLRTIDSIIDPLVAEFIGRRVETRELQLLRDSLLPELMTGHLTC